MKFDASFIKSVYKKKKIVKGQIVTVLNLVSEKRDLSISNSFSSAVKKYEIHELTTTDEKNTALGQTVNSVGYLGFFEVKSGGMIVIGDNVSIKGKTIGKIVGFGKQHMPNHLNLIIYTSSKKTGTELNINIGDDILFEFKLEKGDED